SAEKKWPVIIAFEPAGWGLIPVKLFKNAAEKYGYIVVCSNNSRNGPWKDIIRSMKSVWIDIHQRFSINDRRVYTTGFSGGARAASLFSQIIGVEPAGIIACGAGLQEKLNPSQIKGSFYYGIIGLEDFNYKEFQRLVPELEKAGVRYCIDYVPGIHKWPDEDVVNRAIEWMEVDSVLRGITKEDKGRTDKIFLNSKAYAESLMEGDKFYYGVLYLGSITKHFKMILPVDDLEIKINMLIKEKRFIQFKKEENDRYKKEYQFIGNFKKVFSLLKNKKNMRFGLQSVLNDLRVRYLLNLDKKKKRSFNSYWAKRLLYEIAIKANRFSFIYSDKKDEKRAILFGELAVGTEVNKNLYNFRLASIYAVFGKKKRCIKIIKPLLKEVDNLMDFIEKDPNFNELLKDPDFMSVFINK
ncbi:MAG: hypothetical protein KAR14_00655, partial [Candidatus Aminicenantes bacterium]|nr:hypothetical protein [Candidatus Aminicenantes bacterium]